MSQWTQPARAALERYFSNARKTYAASGADADEVVDNLRRHVEEEISASRLGVVTEQDIHKILARIGVPEGGTATAVQAPRAAVAPAAAAVRSKPGYLILFFGILLPAGTIAFEYFTGSCAGILFDPYPSVWNVWLTLIVPVFNLWLWVTLRRESPVLWRGLGVGNGAAVGVAAIYALLFLPLTPFAVIGIIFYGIGLLPLAPLCGLIGAWLLRKHLQIATQDTAPIRGFWGGVALGVGGLVLGILPMALTQSGLGMALSSSVAESGRGLWWLRHMGNEEQLLRACYGRAGRAGELYNWWGQVNPEDARAVYFRVYGRAFSSVPPPKLYAGRERWSLMEEEFTWDRDQGGDAVAGRVKGLSLLGSRQDGFVDADGALSYTEWTLEFKNDSRLPREARAQVLLPPGGVVSRLTLWIDGEEREAAFGGRSQVKAAYKEVVVVQRRDPVLVTTSGPDRVLVQCYPVPVGGRMKVRMGVTAPLEMLDPAQGVMRWPRFLERNFTLPETFRHSVWMESRQPLKVTPGSGLIEEQPKPGTFMARGDLRDGELARGSSALLVSREGAARRSWARDSRVEDGSIVRQELRPQAAVKPGRIVVVVDGTRGMEKVSRQIEQALSMLPGDVEFSLLLARDGVLDATGSPRKPDDQVLRAAAVDLQRNGKGGHDNVPALVKGWDLAAEVSNGVMVWIHGPQPVPLSSMEQLQQRFERSPVRPRFISVQTEPGPNCVLERLDGRSVQSFHCIGELEQDLKRLFKTISGEVSEWSMVRERTQEEFKLEEQGPETSLHAVRLWAAEEVGRLRRQHRPEAAMKLAGLYQLVTPVSGAVVLETQQQYERAGLEPVPTQSVPMVPEPSTGFLVLLGAGLWVMRKGFRWRAG